ncbi:ectoine/hydroxyectoine ABC transporter substrate-binding protein EhuB [Rhizobium jaguaris]|uniref:Ectoine/hydroxyectoine ABC transporter substrate-binding protein EhuB n=1 Tax=Rhizobium jaguaris TaxID=1312183 RepID=A0A387G8C8_9HYPH|nr:ectoine/hydroxyectoine ABC transporter substrate-binding protein EhuB [Rhizobium jaguaris]AYG64102.1 ectoine/hydroxyectoine ABC transporter substrate-binding protein EhuB [Rhizobium jaguaris]
MKKRKHGSTWIDHARRQVLRGIAIGVAAIAIAPFAASASAESLLEKIKNGETIRIGFSNEIPWAYPGDNNEPLGFVNAMAIDILKKMGTTKIEPVETEWGSLVPGLQAGRFDIITGGMFIYPERCRNVLFSEPLGNFTDALLVQKGNPKDLHSYEDVRDKGLIFVTASGWEAVKSAKRVGIPDDKVLKVAGAPEVTQAVKAGRADAGAGDYFTLKKVVENDNSLELADPYTSPDPAGYPAFAFLPSQQAEVDAFNAAMKDYIGTDAMLAAVSKYGYTKKNLPNGTKTADLCKQP